MYSLNRSRRRAQTLTEMLVVFAVGLLVLGLTLGALVKAREAALIARCRNNLKQLDLAVISYHGDWGVLPSYASGKEGEIYGGWFVHLLPRVGYRELYERIRAGQVVAGSDSRPVLLETFTAADGIREVTFPLLTCPLDLTSERVPGIGVTNYLANWYSFADGSSRAYSRPRSFAQLSDGCSNVVLFSEGYAFCDKVARIALDPVLRHNFGITSEGKPSDDSSYLPNDYTMFQIRPLNDTCHNWRTQTPHPKMPVAFADGSVRMVADSIDPVAWKHLLKPSDEESVGNSW